MLMIHKFMYRFDNLPFIRVRKGILANWRLQALFLWRSIRSMLKLLVCSPHTLLVVLSSLPIPLLKLTSIILAQVKSVGDSIDSFNGRI